MAKRGAEEQISKDDERSDGEEGNDPGVRSAPLAPVEGRQIRGMPKRRGLGGAPAPGGSAAAPAPAPAALTGFSFGAPPTSGSTPFVFGSGAGSAPASSPAAPLAITTAAAASPFAGFSFASKPSAPAASADAPKASAPAFGFGLKPTPLSAAPAPVADPVNAASSSPFSFGAKPSAPAVLTPASTSAPSAPPAQPPKPFANFSFANTSSTSSLAPTVSETSVSSTTSPFGFGGSAAQSSTSTSSFAPTTSKPTETSVAAPATPVSIPSDPSPSQSTPPDEKQVSYYTSLRGLNTSFLSFLTTSLENDPFLDLSSAVPGLLKQYNSYVDVAATKAGWRPEGPKTAAAVNGESTKPQNGLPKPPAPLTVGGFALPKAPTVSSTPTPSFGAFTPSLPAVHANGSSSPFSFGGPKPAPVPTPKKPSAEVTQLVQDVISGKDDTAGEKKDEAPKPFTFDLSTAPAASESAKKPTTLFSFSPSAPLHPPTPESKKFAPSASLEPVGTPAKLGKFGPGGSQPQLAFGGAKSSPAASGSDSPATAKPFSFGFGAGSGSPAAPASSGSTGFSFGGSSASSTTSAIKPAFSFGSSSQPTSSSAFSFGGASTENKAPPASSSSFSFTPLAAKPADTPSADEGKAAEGESTPAPGSPSKNLAETIGAGEENEDTVVEQRGKLHSLIDGKFSLEGLGQFKLKRTKEGGKRRLLMRTDGNGNVILNMSLSKSFKPTAEGPTVRFLGFNKDGKPVPYALRVKNAQVATDLSKALEKEVEAIEG